MADRISYGPFTLYESEAYKRGKQLEGTKKALEVEEKLLEIRKKEEDLQKAYRESPEGRIAQAEKFGMIQERSRQQEEGIQIGPQIAKATVAAGGPSLLEATQMQGDLLVRQRAEQNRLAAMENILTGGQGIVPTAKVDVGGITATVPFQSAGEKMSQAYKQQYQGMVPVVAEKYIAEGYDRDSAIRKASEDVGNTLIKKSFNGEIPIYAIDGQTVMQFLPQKEAIKMFQDPKTPKFIASQLEQYFGPKGQSAAQDWVKSRIGR